MPEGDTIFRAARTLSRAIGGQTVTRFETMLPKLARIDVDTPVAGRIVEKVEANGKWMLIRFSGDLILLTHMLMSGSWHIYRPGETWQRGRIHMRIVIETPSMLAVAFNVPVAEFHTEESLARREGWNALGPDVLSKDFDEAAAIANLVARPEMEVGPALLNQSSLAGIGNVFKSEIAFACGVNPFRTVGSLTPMNLADLVSTARKFLRANVLETSGHIRTTGSMAFEKFLWVYRRAGEPCRKCGTPIRTAKHQADARVTFWCPVCQK